MALRALALGGLMAVLVSAPAEAQRTRFDGLRQCERHAGLQFRRHNPQFRRFLIDRATVETDRYADQIGTQFVSTVYHGKGMYEAASGPKTVRFICLHGGYRRGALFVYTLD